MFYNSLLDLQEVHGDQQPDVLFVQANGKHRMAALAEALVALDVPVDIIADMDVLNEENTFKRIIMSLGGDWESIKSEARPLKTAIEEHKPWLNTSEVAKGIRLVLDETPPTGEFSSQLLIFCSI